MSAVPRSFSYGEAFRHGWRAFTANIGPMALYALVVLGVSILVNLVFGRPDGTQSFLGNLVGFLVNQLITIGWLRIALDAVDGREVDTSRVRDAFSVFVPFLVAAILFSIGVAVGLVLLIVPGIIFAIVFGFYGYGLVDGVVDDGIAALRHSAEITRGNRWQLFGFGIVLIAFNLLGLLLLIVGVLVTSAVSILALAYVYRQLAGGAPSAA